MSIIRINETERTPKILFDLDNNHLSISGESYPENVFEFYHEPIRQLSDHLSALHGASLTLEMNFIYFNSSSTKIFMKLFDLMEQTAKQGNRVEIHWYYEKEDENMREMGETFSEDLQHVHFHLLPTTS
ncbi:MAG: DUF1987 domain-containing protein [Magnetococcales bacterium]|nr:DUF1987 domain-containing protein [Magnetococcales bacterium]MBF0439517.1 DUF1987 domain-containing protein [Magnetococcales bacterium]